METIDDKQLKDESVYPDENVRKPILGKSYGAFCELLWMTCKKSWNLRSSRSEEEKWISALFQSAWL